jgi:type I restriction enzyme, S subunit
MVVENGYKQTEVGLIPEEWEIDKLENVIEFFNGKAHENYISDLGRFVVINSKFISSNGTIAKNSIVNLCTLNKADIAIVMSDIPNGKALAKCFIVPCDKIYALNQRIGGLRSIKQNSNYLFYQLNRNKYFLSYDSGSGQTNLRKQEVLDCPVLLPPLPEQTAIATALSDMDELIDQTEKLIEKKKAIKQGLMQELLRPKEGWVKITIDQCCDILNNLRQPLNDSERQKMKGDIPYCGANGVVDFINEYLTDEDIILMAEDGGYFDEYKTRPIAYRMSGKCWVNNHAHILRAKMNFNQDFIYYSVVHKNILDYINGGTRAKLNKSELKNIEIFCPIKSKQDDISKILSDIDLQIVALENYVVKFKLQKQGMMQALLTGKIRLV